MNAGVSLEQTALGHALNDPECYQLFCQSLDYKDFGVANHRALAFCLIKMSEHGVSLPDEDTFQVVLPTFPEDDRNYGGSEYIRMLKKSYSEKCDNYELIIRNLRIQSVKSKIGSVHLERILKAINSPASTPAQVRGALDGAMECLEDVDITGFGFSDTEQMVQCYSDELDKRAARPFFTTGLSTLDEHLTEGFVPGKITVVAGFTGMAKSTVAVAMAHRVAAQKFGTAIFSMENQKEGVWDKLVSSLSQIPIIDLKKNVADLSLEKRKRIDDALGDISGVSMLVNDQVSMSMAEMSHQIAAAKRRGYPIDVVFIDLFGKLEDVDTGENLAPKIQQKCKLLRALAQEHATHFVAMVQIGRQGFGMGRGGSIKRPVLTDIKNANAYAEEADIVLLLHRNKYYLPELEDDILEVHVAKQREGESGQICYLEMFADRATLMATHKRPHDHGAADA